MPLLCFSLAHTAAAVPSVVTDLPACSSEVDAVLGMSNGGVMNGSRRRARSGIPSLCDLTQTIAILRGGTPSALAAKQLCPRATDIIA